MNREPLIVPWSGRPSREELESFCWKVHDEMFSLLYRSAVSITRNQHMAEESVQEGEIALFKALRDDGLDGNIAPWLIKTVCNRAINHLRHASVRNHHDVHGMQEELAAVPEIPMEDVEAWTMAWNHLLCLPDQIRIAFTLRVLEDRTYEEIGGLLGCSHTTACKYYQQARSCLLDGLNSEIEYPDNSL